MRGSGFEREAESARGHRPKPGIFAMGVVYACLAALALTGCGGDPYATVRAQVEHGDALMAAGRPDEALHEFRPALEEYDRTYRSYPTKGGPNREPYVRRIDEARRACAARAARIALEAVVAWASDPAAARALFTQAAFLASDHYGGDIPLQEVIEKVRATASTGAGAPTGPAASRSDGPGAPDASAGQPGFRASTPASQAGPHRLGAGRALDDPLDDLPRAVEQSATARESRRRR